MSDVEKNSGTHKPEFDGERCCGERGVVDYVIRRLDECADILDSERVPIAASNREPGPYPYYGANGIQDWVAGYIFDDELVLLAEDGGRFGVPDSSIAYRVSGKCWVNNHAHVLRARDGIDPDYLCYSLMNYDTSKLINGTTRSKLTQAAMKKMEIRIRSRERQGEIVRQIKSVTEIEKRCHDLLSALDDLVKSQFVEMFGTSCNTIYPVCSVKELCSAIVDCPHATPRYQGNLVKPCIRTSELAGNSIEWSTMRYVSQEEYLERTRRIKPLAGDVVYAREGSYGNAAVLPDGIDFCLGQRTMLFRPHPKRSLSAYVLHALTSDDVRRQADMLNSGSTVPHVNVADAKRFVVPNPPLALQQEFADFVARVDKLGFDVQLQVEKLETLKQSLMQEYFG